MLITGTVFTSITKELTQALSPVTLLLMSETLLMGFLLMSFGIIPLVNELKKLKERDVIALFWIAVFFGVIGPLMWFSGISLTTATNAELMSKFQILFVFFAGAVYLKETVTLTHLLAAITTLFGLLLITTDGFGTSLSLNIGDVFIILSGVAFGMGTILTKKYASHIHVHAIVFVRSIITLTLFGFAEVMIPSMVIAEIRAFPTHLIPTLIVFALVCRFIGIIARFESVERMPITVISLITPLTTVSAILFAMYYLGEEPSTPAFIGGLFIVSGSILTAFVQTKKDHAHVRRHMKLHTKHHMKLF